MLNEKKKYHQEYYQKNRDTLLAQQKLRQQKAEAENPEQRKNYRKEYYQKNKERLLELQRERNRANYKANKHVYKARNRRAVLKQYGLTPDEYQDILDAQGGGCAICTASARTRKMVVDHCHQTGKIRGILCNQCNTAIGLLAELPGRIMEAADYLIRSSSGATSMTSSEQ